MIFVGFCATLLLGVNSFGLSFPIIISIKIEFQKVHMRWCDIHLQIDVASLANTFIQGMYTCISKVI